MSRYYIRQDGNEFYFIVDGLYEIKTTDKEISIENYKKFFEMQGQCKEFRIKNIDGETFEEIFEEIIKEEVIPSPTLEDRVQALEDTLLQIL